ncbi:MAG: cation:proton antiporter [Campylobacteraceae bacterium]|jgi:CPA2 family monovalent cation:H+ antiporter-2|nr:cation:proton antiporter [Campylobacteraceae bacterium]
MHENQLFIVSFIIFFAIILNLFLKRIGISTIIGYIITGVAARQFFGLTGSEELTAIAEFGVVFLMFMIGLEFSLEKLSSMKKEVLGLGGLQVLVSGLIFGFILHHLLDFDKKIAVALGFTLALSSTTIILKILQETGKMGRNHGRNSIGILLMQDIAVVPILILVTILADTSQDLGTLLWHTGLNSIGGMIAIYFFGKYGVSYFLKHVTGAKSNELFMMAVLLIVITSAAIAHFFHVPYSLGAFIAGIIISESAYKHQIEADLIPFRDLLLGVFFLSIGILIDVHFLIKNILLIALMTIGIMAAKTVIIFYLSKMFRYSSRTAIKTALLLSQIGEFSFVIFAYAKSISLISEELAQTFIAVAALSMIITPFLAKYLAEISYRFTKSKDSDIIERSSAYKNHVVVIGFGNTGKAVIRNLTNNGFEYIAVENQRDLVYDAQARGHNVIFGNAMQKNMLETLKVKEASAVVVTTDKEEELLTICEVIRFNYPKVNLVARTKNDREYRLIKAAGVDLLVDESEEVGKKLVEMALMCKIHK